MKVPKTPAPPGSGGEHDTTWTRRNVKGAAGGLEGVDYQTDRRPDAAAGGADAAAGQAGAKAKPAKPEREAEARPLPLSEKRDEKPLGMSRETPLVLEEEEVANKDPRKRKPRKPPTRDRLSVDKDAPELLRARRWTEDEEDDDAPHERDEQEREAVLDLDFLAEEVGERGGVPSRAHLFVRQEQPEPGDPSLVDPDEIQRALKTPLAYAKHVMILSEAFRRSTGGTRGEAIEYLARMFVAPSDRSFARNALKEFGPSSGIIDIYPLEVVAHVLQKYPGFLNKVGFGRLFRNVPEGEARLLFTDTKTPVVLEYPPELKIRGFAIAGGGRPGYMLEPDEEPGRYRLHIQTAGRFELLVSALNRQGYTTIDRVQVTVRPRTAKELAAMREDATYYPERDEARVAAWPMPDPPRIDPYDLLDEEDSAGGPRARDGMMSSGEIVRRQQIDAMRGPQRGEWVDRVDFEPALGSREIAVSEDLAEEDAEVLREAVESVLAYAEVLAADTDEERAFDVDEGEADEAVASDPAFDSEGETVRPVEEEAGEREPEPDVPSEEDEHDRTDVTPVHPRPKGLM